MTSILETCLPREELLNGTFNPEIFTAAIGPVIKHYRAEPSAIDRIYTDAEAFFTQATFPTQGLINTVTNVFRRISGDATAPAIQRLETAFGGGKTHTLIACTHIAYRGKTIAPSVNGLLAENYLPDAGEVKVVGIAGDEIAVSKARGDELIPHTLWGEIAWQIGGEELYRKIQDEAESHAAPGKLFLEKVLGGRKVLIMLDELAQYAARLEVAQKHGAEQLSAFLMALNGFARERHGLAILVTLAGSADAFARQTGQLTQLLNQLSADSLSDDDATAIGERAVKGIASVISRDATVETPVQASEISSVLSKRLFARIDSPVAETIAEQYMQMYRRNSSTLPEEAIQESYKDRIRKNYPFHPTLIDFLNQKLSIAENFQGTRGVLRVLAMTVRQIWLKKYPITMIHASNIDMRDGSIVNEILGRTGSADLLNVLNADIGGVNTSMQIEGGISNAERADRRNPHPDQIPIYEHTWKTVFLHSLVGRSQGAASRIFGLSESEAIFTVATPLAPPAQIRTALQEINESAFFLRYNDGKYFADLDPTINSVLARIRNTVTVDQINTILKATAKKLITDSNIFHVEHDVSDPEHLPDNKEKPVLGIVSISAGTIDIEMMITTKGQGRPRERQNLIFLLVPKTVEVRKAHQQTTIDQVLNLNSNEDQQRIEGIARQVVAMHMLENSPQNYGITLQKLQNSDFRVRHSERDQALLTAVSEVYTNLYYSSVNGDITRKEIKAISSEGGASVINLIHETLIREKELLTAQNNTTTDLDQLRQLFFSFTEPIKVNQIAANFLCARRWPVLDSIQALPQLLRAGVEKGIWIVYKLGNPSDPKPTELYTREKTIPYTVDLRQGEYSLISIQGATLRGWLTEERIDPEQVYHAVQETLHTSSALTLRDVINQVDEKMGAIPEDMIRSQVLTLTQRGQAYVYSGQVEQKEKPDSLTSGIQSSFHILQPDDVLITPASVGERGWQVEPVRSITLDGQSGAQKLFTVMPRLASLYTRGQAKSTLNQLELIDLDLGNSATMRIAFNNLDPTTIKKLDELLATVVSIAKVTNQTDSYIKIENPVDSCALIEELKK